MINMNEETFYEGGPAKSDLIINLLAGITILGLPFTFAAIVRALWLRYKVTTSNPDILLTHKFSNTSNKFRVAIAISKKVSKKAVERNKLRRTLQEWLLTNIQKINNHKPYWLLVNLKIGDFCNDKSRLLEEFQNLMFKSRLILSLIHI